MPGGSYSYFWSAHTSFNVLNEYVPGPGDEKPVPAKGMCQIYRVPWPVSGGFWLLNKYSPLFAWLKKLLQSSKD